MLVQHPDQHSTYFVQRNRRHERLKGSPLNHAEIEEVLGPDGGELRGVSYELAVLLDGHRIVHVFIATDGSCCLVDHGIAEVID